jgi:hypothetical protein
VALQPRCGPQLACLFMDVAWQPRLKHRSAGFTAQVLGDAGANHLHQIFTSKKEKHLAVTLSA